MEILPGGSTASVNQFPGRLALLQRVLPAYRAPFFDLLASASEGGLSILAGNPRPMEGIVVSFELAVARTVKTRNLHFRDPASSLYLCWQRGVVPWLRDWDPDGLIVEANPRYLSTRLAVNWMKRRGRPVLGWGLGALPSANPIERALRRSFLLSLDGVIAYSQRGAAEYRALGAKAVTVASNAVSHRPQGGFPARPAVKTSKPVVLFVGRLQERKRVDILLRACRDLPVDLRPELAIIGDGPARAAFEELAEQIYPQAVFTGAVHGKDLGPYYQDADLFALPGTGGLAVQQAMAYGLPVIVAQGDGTQDDLVRPENGWQVPPDDQRAFTAVLAEALSDLDRLRQMGKESFRIVVEEVNLEAMVVSFIEALDKARQP